MDGYVYGEPEPTERCPYCNTECHADFCDIGVGVTQCGPYHCDNCLASEIGPYDESRPLSDKEKETGWYAPGAEPGSSANVIGGTIVDHKTMQGMYRFKFQGNPEYDVPGKVEAWLDKIRRPQS